MINVKQCQSFKTRKNIILGIALGNFHDRTSEIKFAKSYESGDWLQCTGSNEVNSYYYCAKHNDCNLSLQISRDNSGDFFTVFKNTEQHLLIMKYGRPVHNDGRNTKGIVGQERQNICSLISAGCTGANSYTST